MGETLCKVCGYRGTEEETACPECGAPLFPVEQAPIPAQAPVTAGVKREHKQKKDLSGKAMFARRAAWLLLVCLAVQGLGLWSLTWRQGGNGWSVVWGSDLVTPRGIWRLGEESHWTLAGDSRHPHKVLVSGSWLYSRQLSAQRTQRQISYYDGKTVTQTDWHTGTISGNGKVLFYLRSEGEDIVLYRQDLSRGPAREVDRARGNTGLGITSAWDGSAAVWWASAGEESGQRFQRQWDGKRGGQDIGDSKEESILWLGKDGDSALLVRTTDVDMVYAFYLRWGQGERELDIEGEYQTPVLNWELTQALYPGEEGRYCYEELDREPVAVTGVPEGIWLAPLIPQGGNANVMMASYSARQLTDWVYYGRDEHLYYLGSDLKATDLTPEWQARDYLIDEEGDTLYCSSSAGGLYRMDRPGPRGSWTQLDERGGWELDAAPDLSVIGYQTWQDSKMVQELLDAKTGERTTLGRENREGSVCWLKTGAIWRLDGENKLWFWAPGEKEERQVSLGGEGEQSKLRPHGYVLQVVGDGSQAVLCLGPGSGHILYGSLNGGWADNEPERQYWLLDNRGNATRLETLPGESE